MVNKDLMGLAESIQQLYEQDYIFYSPIVEELCNRNDISQKEFEDELDGMLSFCQSDNMLVLFKSLCIGCSLYA